MTLVATDYTMLIGGDSAEALSGERFVRESPAHDVVVGTYPSASVEDVDRAVETARDAFDRGSWPRESGAVRGRLLVLQHEARPARAKRAVPVENYDRALVGKARNRGIAAIAIRLADA